MLNFWDEVFFEKIREIYDSDAFTGEELQEIEYTFLKSYNKLITNVKRKGMFTKFYVFIFFSYFVVKIMSVFENRFTEKDNDNPTTIDPLIADEVISYCVVILGFILILIDAIMVYFFYTATSKFIELLLYKKDQQCNRRIVRTVNVLVIILIICKSIGSHVLDNGFYLYKLIMDTEGENITEHEF